MCGIVNEFWGATVTDEEMAAEAKRAILKYAHSEKVIRCLSDKFAEISRSLGRLSQAADRNQANELLKEAVDAIGDRDLVGDANRLAEAISDRGDLESKMTSHGYAHMIRKSSGGRVMPAGHDD